MGVSTITQKTISNLRPFLIIGILLIHSWFCGEISSWNFFEILGVYISNDATRVCVPLFFFLSAYLLFIGCKEMSWTWYKSKLKSRTLSLLVPYILWNSIAFFYYEWVPIIHGEKTLLQICQGMFNSCIPVAFTFPPQGFFNDPSGYPADAPLWFIYTLYAYVIVSPLFYFLIKKMGVLVVIAVSTCYLLDLFGIHTLLNANGITFFTLGAFFGLRKIDLSDLVSRNTKIKIALCAFYVPLFLLDPLARCLTPVLSPYIHCLQVFIGVPAFFIVARHCTLHGLKIKISGQCVFAIYVLHILAGDVTNSLFTTSRGLAELFLCSIARFTLMLFGSIFIYKIIRYAFPWLADLLFGRREIPFALRNSA